MIKALQSLIVASILLSVPLCVYADGMKDDASSDSMRANGSVVTDGSESRSLGSLGEVDSSPSRSATSPISSRKKVRKSSSSSLSNISLSAPSTNSMPSSEKLATSVGHLARARSLLIAAVREFDEGQKLADSSALVNVGEWRDGVISKAEELQRVLDPQPRTSKTGIKYSGDSRLIGVK